MAANRVFLPELLPLHLVPTMERGGIRLLSQSQCTKYGSSSLGGHLLRRILDLVMALAWPAMCCAFIERECLLAIHVTWCAQSASLAGSFPSEKTCVLRSVLRSVLRTPQRRIFLFLFFKEGFLWDD